MNNAFKTNIKKGLYQFWYWNHKDIYDLKYSEFNEIYNALIEEYKNQIVNNSNGIILDNFLGEIASEWVKSKKAEQKYLNLSTNFKTIRIVYKIRKAVKSNKYIKLLSFQPCADLKNRISHAVKDQTEIYKNARTVWIKKKV